MQAKVKKPMHRHGDERQWRGSSKGKIALSGLAIIAGSGNLPQDFKVRYRFYYLQLIFLIAFLISYSSQARGAGFAMVQQGTAAMGQGNAFVADASDATAIFYNPAGLNQLKGAQVYQGTLVNYPDREFHGEGKSSETNHRIYDSANFYFAIPVHNRVALGLGFFAPFGMGSAWSPEWQGRYITTYSSLKTYNLNPVISAKVLENLSLAAGFNVMWSRVELKRKVQAPFPGFADGESRLAGSGEGYGYNLGVLYEPVSGVKLGVAFRSGIFVKYRGDISLNFTPSLPVSISSTGSAGLNFPPSLTWGINYSRLKPFGRPLALEFDTTWTGWSSYNEFRAKFDRPLLKTYGLFVPKEWHDAWAFRFGANYEVKEGMKLRVGYIYDLTPVPDSTFEPQLPDANRHVFTVGSDLKVWRFTLGIAYNFILAESRTKNNIIAFNGAPAPLQANGRYNSNLHSLMCSWLFQF